MRVCKYRDVTFVLLYRSLLFETMTTAVRKVLEKLRRRVVAAKRATLLSFLNQERFRNREGFREYDFVLHESRAKNGISLLVRARSM